MDDLEALYQEVILESSRNPTFRGNLRDNPEAVHAMLKNPLCGDTVELWLSVRDGVIQDVRFDGVGCSISVAATAMMAERIRGRSVADARRLAELFRAMLQGPDTNEAPQLKEREAAASVDSALGDLTALKGVQRFPQRARCATLGFEALERALARASTLSNADPDAAR